MSFTLHSITMPFRTTNRSLCFLNTAWTSIANTTTYTRCPRKSFSGSSISLSSKNKQQKIDPRVTLIRYHMQHPLMPRPLRLSRGRALRHWTIARAWSLWEKKKKMQANLELQRLYQNMQLAMEVLRNLDDGTTSSGTTGSRLFRIALEKKGIYNVGAIPIEYARQQTETPSLVPWDHNWKR